MRRRVRIFKTTSERGSFFFVPNSKNLNNNCVHNSKFCRSGSRSEGRKRRMSCLTSAAMGFSASRVRQAAPEVKQCMQTEWSLGYSTNQTRDVATFISIMVFSHQITGVPFVFRRKQLFLHLQTAAFPIEALQVGMWELEQKRPSFQCWI